MKNVKRIALMLVCILVVGVLGGCGAKFDPVAYTQANLDNVFKNDSAKLVEMGAGTAEEAEEIFNQGIDAQMAAFTMTGIELSEELTADIRTTFVDLFSKVKYKVESAEKQEDGSYIVTVTYEKMKFFGPAMAKYYEEMNKIDATQLADADEAALMELSFSTMNDCFKATLENVEYEAPATTTVKIEMVDKKYTMTEAETTKFADVVFDGDAISNN